MGHGHVARGWARVHAHRAPPRDTSGTAAPLRQTKVHAYGGRLGSPLFFRVLPHGSCAARGPQRSVTRCSSQSGCTHLGRGTSEDLSAWHYASGAAVFLRVSLCRAMTRASCIVGRRWRGCVSSRFVRVVVVDSVRAVPMLMTRRDPGLTGLHLFTKTARADETRMREISTSAGHSRKAIKAWGGCRLFGTGPNSRTEQSWRACAVRSCGRGARGAARTAARCRAGGIFDLRLRVRAVWTLVVRKQGPRLIFLNGPKAVSGHYRKRKMSRCKIVDGVE